MVFGVSSWFLVCLLRENARLQFGDAAVAIGVATTDRPIEGDVFAFEHAPFMIEDHRDGNFRLALAPAVSTLHFAEGFVEQSSGRVVLELYFYPYFVAVHGPFGLVATAVQHGQRKQQGRQEVGWRL